MNRPARMFVRRWRVGHFVFRDIQLRATFVGVSSDSTLGMPQLLVRDIEPAIVKKLRSSAAAQGVSVEEAHRRLLRSSLLGGRSGSRRNFLEYLRRIPRGDDTEFPRATDLPRPVGL